MDETTLRDYIRVLFRQKAVIITAFVTVMVTVTIGLILMTPVYEAQVKLLVSGEKTIISPYQMQLMSYQNTPIALTQTEIVQSNPVMERAVKALGLYTKPLDYEKDFATFPKKILISLEAGLANAQLKGLKPEERQAYLYRSALEDLKRSVKVNPVRDTYVFTISARDYSPIGAAVIANTVSRAYVIFDLEQQLADMQIKYGEKNLAVTQLKDNIDKMIKSLNGQPLPDVEAIGPASVKIIEQASVPLKPAGIPKRLTFVLAIFMAVFLSIMLAFMFEYLDQTFKSTQDIEKTLNIPCLGSIPKNMDKESYRHLSDQIYLMLKDKNIKVILMTSADKCEGATTVIANVGTYLATVSHDKTLLIDANLRNPALHEKLNIKNAIGLGNILEEKTTFDSAVKEISAKLSVLTAGNTALNPVMLLNSHKMADLTKAVRGKYGVVIINAPSPILFKDAFPIASLADGVCLVICEGKDRRQAVKFVLTSLVDKKANVLGAILTGKTFIVPKAIYDRV